MCNVHKFVSFYDFVKPKLTKKFTLINIYSIHFFFILISIKLIAIYRISFPCFFQRGLCVIHFIGICSCCWCVIVTMSIPFFFSCVRLTNFIYFFFATYNILICFCTSYVCVCVCFCFT